MKKYGKNILLIVCFYLCFMLLFFIYTKIYYYASYQKYYDLVHRDTDTVINYDELIHDIIATDSGLNIYRPEVGVCNVYANHFNEKVDITRPPYNYMGNGYGIVCIRWNEVNFYIDDELVYTSVPSYGYIRYLQPNSSSSLIDNLGFYWGNVGFIIFCLIFFSFKKK